MRRRWFVAVAVFVVLGASGAAFLWTQRAKIEWWLAYNWPVDGRERIGLDDGGFNVVVLVPDACRADRSSAYGFARPTTPAIDSLASDPDSVVFERHYVNGNWTKPSTASLFSSLYVHEHGVASGWDLEESAGGLSAAVEVLSGELTTLAEAFSNARFYTFGIVQGRHLDPEFGFDQGFDEWYTGEQITDELIRTQAFIKLMEGVQGRFFGYFHPLGCHRPFPVFARDQEYMEQYGFNYPEGERIEAGVDLRTMDVARRVSSGEITLEDRDKRFLELLYEARMRFADRRLVGPIIQALRDNGLYDNTLVIVTSDHGEALLEHGVYGHGGQEVYEEMIHVPLVVKFPKGMRPELLPRRVEAVTQEVDLLPSLVSLIDEPVPASARGTKLFDGDFGDHALVETGSCLGENFMCESGAYVLGDKKLAWTPGRTALYDLSRNASEQEAPAQQALDARKEMDGELASLRASSTKEFQAEVVEIDVDDDVLQTLKTLGYVQ